MPVPQQETERALVASLAAEAQRLAPSLDLKRSPDQHLYVALDRAGIRDAETRRRLIPEIRKALHRLRPAAPLPFSRRDDLIEDARIQELRHPHDEDGT